MTVPESPLVPRQSSPPETSGPDYGIFVCSPKELRRHLLRESAKHFRRAFELLGLLWCSVRYDLKQFARNSIRARCEALSVFRRTVGNSSCAPADQQKPLLSNVKKVDGERAISDALKSCPKSEISGGTGGKTSTLRKADTI